MKKHLCCYFALLCLVVLLVACEPYTFAPPTQVHITDGDYVEQGVIAVDAAGRSHIAGVVNDRVVYYRTKLGMPSVRLTMTMTGSGLNWRQYNPDIAVTDNGTASVVWVEQRGSAEKYACYQAIPLIPMPGGYNTGCVRLDSTFFSVGNVMVVARENKVYALYDAIDSSDRIGSLWYREMTDTSNKGIIYWYADNFESGYLYSWDAGIDSGGYLHVAFLDNSGVGAPPYPERLLYRSNRSTQSDGQMTQAWSIRATNNLEEKTPISLVFYDRGSVENVIVASVDEESGIDRILMTRCEANGCDLKGYILANLPSAWSTYSVITDVELVGNADKLYLGFIGYKESGPTSHVYVMADAFSSSSPLNQSEGRAGYKFDLEAVLVDSRPEITPSKKSPAFFWGEIDGSSKRFYSSNGLMIVKIHDSNCVALPLTGETASNGYHYAGVWDACSNSWFSAQAYTNQLPLIRR